MKIIVHINPIMLQWACLQRSIPISFAQDPYKTYKSGFVWSVACEYLDLSYPTLQELGKFELLYYWLSRNLIKI